MHYSTSTDNYVNDFLEEILQTGFRYNIPYKIDREKYETTLKNYGATVRVKDSDILSFSYYYRKDELGEYFSFFATHPNHNSLSDNVQFGTFNTNPYEDHQPFLYTLAECILQPSQEHILKMKRDIYDNVSKELSHLRMLDLITTL